MAKQATYNTFWRREERRKAAVDRQRKLCDSGKPLRQKMDGDIYPLPWIEMVPKDQRDDDRWHPERKTEGEGQ